MKDGAHRYCYASSLCWSICLKPGIHWDEYHAWGSHCFILSTYSLILTSSFQRQAVTVSSWVHIPQSWHLPFKDWPCLDWRSAIFDPDNLEDFQCDVWAFCRKLDVSKCTTGTTPYSTAYKGAKYEAGKNKYCSIFLWHAAYD